MYCTEQDLIDRFGERELIQLTDFDMIDEIGQISIDQAIADIDGKIDGFLRSRYALPLVYVPQELIAVACDLTRYQLHRESADPAVTEQLVT
jgi:phage gp36-like protein